ncbi:MAG: IS200/IS605 family transposase [Saprospiraceae bacterium]|nr:IS200/IS605 family transposase [Saprospiraceae bacterium]
MSTTYTQLLIHIVLVVRNRSALINLDWEENLYRYINVAMNDMDSKPLAVNGMPDHVHILALQNKNVGLSRIIQRIKINTTNWINKNRFTKGKFRWQQGYAAFSVSRSKLGVVRNYIINQKAHHKNETFPEEFKRIMMERDLYYKQKYGFTVPQ